METEARYEGFSCKNRKTKARISLHSKYTDQIPRDGTVTRRGRSYFIRCDEHGQSSQFVFRLWSNAINAMRRPWWFCSKCKEIAERR